MNNTIQKVIEKQSGKIFNADYAPNRLGNMRMWVSGKFYSDKQFNKLFQLNTSNNNNEFTYDVQFNNFESTNGKGFAQTIEYCRDYIDRNNGTKESYFNDYVGGVVSIVCNETGETVYETDVIKPAQPSIDWKPVLS